MAVEEGPQKVEEEPVEETAEDFLEVEGVVGMEEAPAEAMDAAWDAGIAVVEEEADAVAN